MNTLKINCVPRKFEHDTDVQDIIDLIENSIDPALFLETNYKTQGMDVLFKTAFERFKKKSQQKLIKLTQSMGGGKTHNMISLGLLAKHPEYRKQIIGVDYSDDGLGEVQVLAFSGRDSNTKNGIWGELARQLGKETEFKSLWEGGLRAPGPSEWINMLKGKPKLILLDELPPYLENAKTIAVGSGDLSIVTTTALANLFNALNRADLDNVLIVISDLKATYQSGTRLLQSSFSNLEGEVKRFALDIQPVSSTSDEIYDILRKKLFNQLPGKEEINEIAVAYKAKAEEAKNLNFTNYNPDKLFTGIKEAYPFHPAIRVLYERFKENQGFQQTRDLIRLMRMVIKDMWESGVAGKRFLINPYDLNLNNPAINTFVEQIKPPLGPAISNDVANEGRSSAEVIDSQYKIEFISQVAKLLLVSSLANVPNALLGLNKNELVGYLVEPGKDITNYRNAFEEFISQAWYIHTDKDGRLHFQNVRNLIAELNSLIGGYDEESARLEIRKFLEERFKPVSNDCYQKVLVFPAIDQIILEQEKILLVLFEPNTTGGGLNPDLLRLYSDTQYKNRIMFLSGDRNTMDNLLRRAKEYKAIQRIIANMRSERVPENNPQFEMAVDREIKIGQQFLSAARETFVKLYYPFQFKGQDKLVDAEFLMDFKGNNYNGEEQVKKVLTERQKFTAEDPKGNSFKDKCLQRLFTLDEMRKVDLKSRAASNPAWQWHHSKALDELIDYCLRAGIWFQIGDYIQKNPPKEETTVTVQATWPDRNKSEAILKILPKFGDVVHYEFEQEPKTTSDKITDFNSWKTDEMIVYFLCVDSKGQHETGKSYKWVNKLNLRYSIYDAGDEKKIKLEASAPNSKILFTTDGSDPKEHGAVYAADFIIPKETRFVLAIAEKKGIYSEKLEIPINWSKSTGFKIDKDIALTYEKQGMYKTNNNKSTYEELDLLNKHGGTFFEVYLNFTFKIKAKEYWSTINFGPDLALDKDQILAQIDFMRSSMKADEVFETSLQIVSIKFQSGQKFLDWMIDKKMQLSNVKQQEIIQ
ncbi:MAG TPA: glycosyl transferase [Lentisphaeria bacterium]|nr:MAG: glycosyl transferase [Lentisphaerae bacterium GWF2_38_69]HBM14779.1 glycosyl transferase [Lentisphaeria bacterium]